MVTAVKASDQLDSGRWILLAWCAHQNIWEDLNLRGTTSLGMEDVAILFDKVTVTCTAAQVSTNDPCSIAVYLIVTRNSTASSSQFSATFILLPHFNGLSVFIVFCLMSKTRSQNSVTNVW
ncbi:hypothetical protein RRG08_005621 [Elysia crispata]|uniref:Uncharacterized protein n=1 Tax=Elysia crispata TaxID=231223 RepID=A0AAE0YY06_9GAST|nr:hypothetical protein RRG08_005621 [Elysia crispata]